MRWLRRLTAAVTEWVVWPVEDAIAWVLRTVAALFKGLFGLIVNWVVYPLADAVEWAYRRGTALGPGTWRAADVLAEAAEDFVVGPVAAGCRRLYRVTLGPLFSLVGRALLWLVAAVTGWVETVTEDARRPALASLLICTIMAAGFFYRQVGDLVDPAGVELAQTARNLAEGRGLTTSAIQPLSLAVHDSVKRHPDFIAPPLQAFVTALAFILHHSGDRTAAAASALFLVPTFYLVFLLGRWLGGTTLGFLATLAYSLSASVLRTAISGSGAQLTALLFALWLYQLLPGEESDDEADAAHRTPALSEAEHWPPKRLFGQGVLFGLLMLADWHFACLWPVAVFVVWRQCRTSWRGLIAVGAGIALLAIPYGVRNARLSGSPLFSLQLYSAVTDTPAHPGGTVWRDLTPSSLSPVALAAAHWQEVAGRVGRRLLQIPSRSAGWLDFYLFVGLLAALLFPPARARASGLWSWLLLFMLARVLVGAAFDWSVGSFVPFAPVAICLGVQALLDVVALGRLSSAAHNGPRLRSHGIAAVLLVMAALPALAQIARGNRTGNDVTHTLAALADAFPPQTVLLSDQPALAAWRVKTPVIGLPLTTRQLAILETQGAPVGGLVLTPNTTALRRVDSPTAIPWRQLYAAPRPFAGYSPQQLPGGVVLYRRAVKPGVSEGDEAK